MAPKRKNDDKKLDGLGGLLDEAEGRTLRKAKTTDPDDLDLDAAWSRG